MWRTVQPSRVFTNDLLQRYRQQGDAPADAVITAVAEEGGREGLSALMRWLGDTKNLNSADQPPVVQQFLTQFSSLPDWANPRLMDQGMQYCADHAGAVSLLLGLYSLPYCYAGADGARVLWLSQRIHQNTQKRLEETGEWVAVVLQKANWANGKAVTYSLKIRLLHAAIRWFTLHGGQWDMTWGYPVNQEDMAATNMAFSYIVIRGLRKTGVTAPADEEAYLHHFNVVGYLLGVAPELLPLNLREAYHLDRLIAQRQFRPSEQGRGLTKSLLTAIETFLPATLRNLPAAQMRFFLGDSLADLLGLPAVPLEKRFAGLVSSLPIFPKLIPSAPR